MRNESEYDDDILKMYNLNNINKIDERIINCKKKGKSQNNNYFSHNNNVINEHYKDSLLINSRKK